MITAIKLIITLAAAILIGSSSALLMSGVIGSHRPNQKDTVNTQGWVMDRAIGTKASSPYMRAFIARRGIFALPNTEAIYFVKNTDNSGRRLRENCEYKISGSGQDAQWWSITLYDEKDFLPLNAHGAVSINKTQISTPPLWTATIRSTAPTLHEMGLWLSSKNAGAFDLTMRLYLPEQHLLTSSPFFGFNPPSIERLHCNSASEDEDTL